MRQILVLAVAVSVSACCAPPSKGSERTRSEKQASDNPADWDRTPVNLQPATVVPVATLLKDYKANEVRADGLYKGKRVSVSGKVASVKKGIGGGMYITVGSGAQFEIPTLQCSLDAAQESAAASLNVGDAVTVSGTISGLMMNVQIRDCRIN